MSAPTLTLDSDIEVGIQGSTFARSLLCKAKLGFDILDVEWFFHFVGAFFSDFVNRVGGVVVPVVGDGGFFGLHFLVMNLSPGWLFLFIIFFED